MMLERERGRFLTVMSILYGLLTISNFSKPLQYLNDPKIGGIVIFGVRFESVISNLLLGPLMGLVVGAYAYGLWRLKPWIGSLSAAYALYVPLNLVLFWYFHVGPDAPALTFLLPYLALALGGSIGTALYLAYHQEKWR